MLKPCARLLNRFFLAAALLLSAFAGTAQPDLIREEGFVSINGSEQWITVTGDRSKPVILFLHGGPGSVMSAYTNSFFKEWEKDYIFVQWDQRGAGRTYGRTAPEELSPAFLKEHPLSTEQMISDGIRVAEYLTHHLRKKKIILFGTSWGSVLGIQMAAIRPDLFTAYIGHSQLIYPSENFKLAYQEVTGMAKAANDQAALQTLAALGAPPYDTARQAGQLMRIIKKYEKLHTKNDISFELSPEYDNEKDEQFRSDGDDYSFVFFTGDKRLGVAPMNRPASPKVFEIPVFLIQGKEDILTPASISKPYFDAIKAPRKEYFLLPQAAHGFNSDVVKTIFIIAGKLNTQ